MQVPSSAEPFAYAVINREIYIHGAANLSHNAFILQYLTQHTSELSPTHTQSILTGSEKRRLVAFIQLLSKQAGIECGLIDGFWGPQTNFAYNSLVYLKENGMLPPLWRDTLPLDVNPNNWPKETEAELIAFYGQPGDESQLIRIDLPYVLRLAWDLNTEVSRAYCHKKVANSIVTVLDKVKKHYNESEIKSLRLDLYGGCYNKRKKNGGSSWSTHAWGIALDFDPDKNQLTWGRDRAHFAKPNYDFWWNCWEQEGWLSLGRTKNFDWMHVQAAR